jgi:hypothetical protein
MLARRALTSGLCPTVGHVGKHGAGYIELYRDWPVTRGTTPVGYRIDSPADVRVQSQSAAIFPKNRKERVARSLLDGLRWCQHQEVGGCCGSYNSRISHIVLL